MEISKFAWNHAKKYRNEILLEYLKYHGPSDLMASETLLTVAIKFGVTNRSKSVPGKTLRCWAKFGLAPLWAAQAAVLYILENGYFPKEELGEAVLIHGASAFKNIDEFIFFLRVNDIQASSLSISWLVQHAELNP